MIARVSQRVKRPVMATTAGHGDRNEAWRPQRGMATATRHGNRNEAWRPQGSPLLYYGFRGRFIRQYSSGDPCGRHASHWTCNKVAYKHMWRKETSWFYHTLLQNWSGISSYTYSSYEALQFNR